MKNRSAALTLASASPHAIAREHASMDALLAATSQIVSAYLVNRPAEHINLTGLTADVFATLRGLAEQEAAATASAPSPTSRRKPAVSVEESVKADYLICLEDGKRVKMLKRHLKSAYNMTPEEYRTRWELPANYPMVAPNYAVVRSQLAKKIGLGRRGIPTIAKHRAPERMVGLR
jgi:predicted transcriptional regulator